MVKDSNIENSLPKNYIWFSLTKKILIILAIVLIIPSDGGAFGFFIGLLFLVGIPSLIAIHLKVKNTFLIYDEKKITIRSGYLSKKSKSIPLDKIENVEINQSLYARIFGVGYIQIWTSSPSQIVISKGNSKNKPDQVFLLEIEDAESLRESLLNREVSATAV
jgi:uncharacterized membrane protein YdbT with pleckstrin-like domain